MKTAELRKLKKGTHIKVRVYGQVYEGEVLVADNWGGTDGWYIEFTDKNAGNGHLYHYWKQGEDGGELIEVNGQAV